MLAKAVLCACSAVCSMLQREWWRLGFGTPVWVITIQQLCGSGVDQRERCRITATQPASEPAGEPTCSLHHSATQVLCTLSSAPPLCPHL